jgi:hypothetical protein
MNQSLLFDQNINTERALLLFFLIVGSIMFALTFTFEYSTAALFPRLTAGTIIVGCLLLLLQNKLPDSVQRIIAEPVSIAQPDSEFEEEHFYDESEESDRMPTTRGIPDPVATFALLLGYIGTSYLIGILWATPVFTLTYSLWFQQSRRTTALIFTTTMIIVLAFFLLVNAQLEDGILLEWIW